MANEGLLSLFRPFETARDPERKIWRVIELGYLYQLFGET